jgi:hypothetical protein
VSWVKSDDRLDDTKKIKRAWRKHRATVGLHAMSKTYSARHETDGLIDLDWIEEKLPDDAEREQVLEVMLAERLYEELPARTTKRITVRGLRITYGPLDEVAYIVHDYLEFNEAKCEAEERRRKEAERKAAARARKGSGGPAVSAERPGGQPPDGARTDAGLRDVSALSRPDPTRPDPTRPDPTRPLTPPNPPKSGGRKRDRDRWESEVAAWVLANPVTEELESRWSAVADELRDAVDSSTFDIWLAGLHLHLDGEQMVLGAKPGQVIWITDRFGKLLADVAEKPVRVIPCECQRQPVGAEA